MICDSCGYKNSSSVKKCVNCGTELASGLSREEISSMIDRLSDRSDALTASRLENILKWVFFSLAAVNLVMCFILPSQTLIVLFAALSAFIAGVCAGYPKVIWGLEKLRLSIYAHVDDATPTDFWSIGRKITYWGFFAVSIALLVITLLMLWYVI